MAFRNLVRLLLQLAVVVYLVGQVKSETITINRPRTMRTEGRMTLEYVRSKETIKHELAFSEVIDLDSKRSKISIGYISYEPKNYYSRDGNIMTVNEKDGKCVCLRELGWKFVPELEWFLELTYTKEELERAMSSREVREIGPSGIVSIWYQELKKLRTERVETYRNVECKVATGRSDRQKAKDILFEQFYPNIKMFDDPKKVSIFSVRETVKNAVNQDGEPFSATITIDYFYSREIDKTNIHHLDKLEEDLNLPFGKGCSEFVTPTRPKSGKQSFIMAYRHQLAKSSISLAYDHEANYLRKELIGSSVMIWDLDEDLLYHENQKVADRMMPDTSDTEVSFDACSVLRVTDEESSGSKLRVPYTKKGGSIEVIEFLGATNIAYLGQTTVRDLPCQVFEAILDEPPRVFDLEPRHEAAKAADEFDYIVQFYIFKTNPSTSSTKLEQIVLVGDQFWPARITLTKRHKPTGRTMLLDQLEITDFHWGLYGWTKKPSELFMLPECFNDEDEQLRINLAISATSKSAPSADTLKALRHNKYQLEQSLLGSVFDKLEISRLHLTEFQLELRPHDVLANLVISDRDEDKELTYFGPGQLPSPDSFQNHRIVFNFETEDDDDSESACVLLASHVSQISMVIYCRDASQGPKCTAIFGESEPAIKQPPASTPSNSPSVNPFVESNACQTYRFASRDPPMAATRDVEKVKKGLTDLSFGFDTEFSPKVKVDCHVEDFDVSRELQLITINNYKYALPNRGESGNSETSTVRAYETVTYDSLGDCTKMCNLDASCKSYSFCSDASLKAARCLLSSLDLRENGVEDQLVRAPALQDNLVLVYDQPESKNGSKIGYTLELKTGCNIYEKNFLSAYAQTDEILRIEPQIASSFISKPTATECARWLEGLETQMADFKSSMFAYCGRSNTCLADANLFVSVQGKQKADDEDEQASADAGKLELSCQIYRRRYQTYFHVSTKVIKPKPQEEAGEHWLKQTELQFNTVEQCARACWDSFGHNCLSFDFCRPRKCTLNLLDQTKPVPSGNLNGEVEHETRLGCLHYERDLKWDQLRRDHLLGHHNPLAPIQTQATSSSGGGFVRNLFLTLVTGVLFVVGLAVGRVFNDRLENATLLRSRNSIEPYGTTTMAGNNFGSGLSLGQSIQRISSKFNIENEIYEDPEAIRMEEFGQRKDASTDELNKASEDEASSSATSNSKQSPSSSRKSNYIDVHNLMQV